MNKIHSQINSKSLVAKRACNQNSSAPWSITSKSKLSPEADGKIRDGDSSNFGMKVKKENFKNISKSNVTSLSKYDPADTKIKITENDASSPQNQIPVKVIRKCTEESEYFGTDTQNTQKSSCKETPTQAKMLSPNLVQVKEGDGDSK